MLEMRFRPCPCKGGLLSNLRHFRLLAYLGSWLYNATRMYIYIYSNYSIALLLGTIA